jgi:hypothetical protein
MSLIIRYDNNGNKYYEVDESYYGLSREPFATCMLITIGISIIIGVLTNSALLAIIVGFIALIISGIVILKILVYAKKLRHAEHEEACKRNLKLSYERNFNRSSAQIEVNELSRLLNQLTTESTTEKK